jgi:hypothetical protein
MVILIVVQCRVHLTKNAQYILYSRPDKASKGLRAVCQRLEGLKVLFLGFIKNFNEIEQNLETIFCLMKIIIKNFIFDFCELFKRALLLEKLVKWWGGGGCPIK